MLRAGLLVLMLNCLGCGAIRNYQLQPFYNEMNTNIGQMSYDHALTRWGQPVQVTQGNSIYVATWGNSSNSAVGIPIGTMYAVENINHGWRLDLTFDKSSHLLTNWQYREW